MKQSIPILTLSFTAPGVVAAHRGVKFSGAQATVQGEKVAGVARSAAAAANDKITVDVKGTTTVESGAAFALGDSLIVDAQGRAIVQTSALRVKAGVVAVTSTAANGAILEGGDATEYVFADALEAAGGAGEFVEVLLRR